MVIIALAIFGLCLGSFVNALVWRVHEQSRAKGSKQKAKNLSILRGRSICTHCGHKLAAKDLIPVLSWLMLRGKCRYCGKPIDDSPLVEITTAFAFVISYIYWPYQLNGEGLVLFIFWLVFLPGLVSLAVYDLRWYLLPDRIIRLLIILGLIQAIVLLAYGPLKDQLTGLMFATLIGGGIFYVIFQISRGKWIGGGDVKLGALLGLILADGGLMILTLFSASLIGTAFALPLLFTGKLKRSSKIPFGPFLIIGAFIARLFGHSIIAWYKSKLLIY